MHHTLKGVVSKTSGPSHILANRKDNRHNKRGPDRLKIRDVLRRLHEDGWYVARSEGSH